MRIGKRIPAIVAVLLAIFAADSALAQSMYLGAKGGLNVSIAKFDGTFIPDEEARAGLSAGAAFALDFSKRLRLQVEGLYSQKGVNEKNGANELNLAYIEIPILAVVKITQSKLSPHLHFGPVLSLEVTCKVTTDSVNNERCDDVLLAPGTKTADVGVIFGGGFDVNIARGTLILDGSFNVGLTDLSQDPLESIKNRTLYLSAGFLLPLFPLHR